jgi:hypothetical protein
LRSSASVWRIEVGGSFTLSEAWGLHIVPTSVEVVSKYQIAFESKAQADEKVVVLSIHGSM